MTSSLQVATVTPIHEWSGLYQLRVAVPTSKKRAKKATANHPEFVACAAHMKTLVQRENHKEWAKYFHDCSEGKLPVGFSIVGATICFSTSRKKPSISLTMEIPELCERLIQFFCLYDKKNIIFEEGLSKPKKKSNYENVAAMKWSCVRKKSVRNNLIRQYVESVYIENQWDISTVDDVYTKIIRMSEVYGLDLRHVEFSDGCITNMPCVRITNGDVTPVTLKPVASIKQGGCDDLDEPAQIYNSLSSNHGDLLEEQGDEE